MPGLKGQAGMKDCPICGSVMIRGLNYWLCSKPGCPGLLPLKPHPHVTVVPNGFVTYRPDGSAEDSSATTPYGGPR